MSAVNRSEPTCSDGAPNHTALDEPLSGLHSVWSHARPTIVALGHGLHSVLDIQELTLAWRDMHPEREGHGIHLQYSAPTNASDAHRAWVAIMIRLAHASERGVALAWQVKTLAALEQRDGSIEVLGQDAATVPLHRHEGLRHHLRDISVPFAREFFATYAACAKPTAERESGPIAPARNAS